MDIHLPSSPIPVFPLRGVFLFPYQVLPLHVFEPRYRQMIEDLLDGPGLMVVASPADDGPAPGLPCIAGLGEILRHDRLADGRFSINLLGRARVRIHEVPQTRAYRHVTCEPFPEVDVTAAEVEPLRRSLRAAAAARTREPLPLPDATPVSLLADLLLQMLRASPAVVERAFAEPSVAARARFVLRAARVGASDTDAEDA